MTLAKFKQALLSTGYNVSFTNEGDIAYNESTLLVKVIEFNTLSYWIKAIIYITAFEPADFLQKIKKVDGLVLTKALASSTSYYDDRFTWYQEVLYHINPDDINEDPSVVEEITLEVETIN